MENALQHGTMTTIIVLGLAMGAGGIIIAFGLGLILMGHIFLEVSNQQSKVQMKAMECTGSGGKGCTVQ